jgi:hypothetical protein
MPKLAVNQEWELRTRNDFVKCDAIITVTVEGKELPTMQTLGRATELAAMLIQEEVTKSFKVVPENVSGTATSAHV